MHVPPFVHTMALCHHISITTSLPSLWEIHYFTLISQLVLMFVFFVVLHIDNGGFQYRWLAHAAGSHCKTREDCSTCGYLHCSRSHCDIIQLSSFGGRRIYYYRIWGIFALILNIFLNWLCSCLFATDTQGVSGEGGMDSTHQTLRGRSLQV